MRIVSNPTRCILFFDVDCDDKKLNVELEQNLSTNDVKVKIFYEGLQITDENLISLVTEYMLQKYIITYDDSEDSGDTKIMPQSEGVRLDPAI
jgi:hypothetical protein